MNERVHHRSLSWKAILFWAAAFTLAIELATLWARFRAGVMASSLGSETHWIIRIHHMFWALPLFALAALLRSRPKLRDALIGAGLGCIASDLIHHFLVLPIAAGNTGWHWP